MPSDIGRGFKFGVGFALGVTCIMMFFLFGVSMCAGRIHHHMMEQMREMMPGGNRPIPEAPDDALFSYNYGKLLVFAAGGSTMTFEIRSTAFTAGGTIPKKYTCDGPDISPSLSWTEPPTGTKSLALIMDDPDAPVGTWVHWVLYNLPPTTRDLPDGTPTTETLTTGAQQGTNDFPKVGYAGPCPPQGPAHRYFFKLYALDTELNLAPKATKKQLEAAMAGHILAQAELMGRYRR